MLAIKCKKNKVLKNKKGRFFTVDIHCHTHLEKADRIVQSLYNPKTDPIFGFASEKSREVNRQQMAIAEMERAVKKLGFSDLSLLERKDILGINAARLLGIRNRALRF